jgi:hypothetical protein
VAREVFRLSEYNIEICHIKGKSNGCADTLCRRPDYDQGANNNTNVVVLPEHVFAKATAIIVHQHHQDEECLKAWVDPHQLKHIAGMWYKDNCVVVTNDLEGNNKSFKIITIPLFTNIQA